MNPKLLSDRQISMVSERERKSLGLQTFEERMKKIVAKNERELQRQIVDYLRLRDIVVIWHRTDKRSTATVGTPDILFAVKSYGIPLACAYEVKFGAGTLTREQNDMFSRMQTHPNAWRIRIIRTFIEVVDDMRDLGL
jgi:hypothetical protein